MSSRTILVWFRNDLRTHDNEILTRALEHGNRIVPVYCFDPRQFEITSFGTQKTGVLRADFIRRNVSELRNKFVEMGGDLLTLTGLPEVVLPALCEKYQVDEVYHHREVALEETHISSLVEAALWKLRINLRHFIGHTLYHKEDLPFPIKDIPDSFSLFKKKAERESQVRPQFPKPQQAFFHPDLEATSLPTLEDLGFDAENIKQTDNLTWDGGENTALNQMKLFLADPLHVGKESHLSPYVAVGALSPNTLYHAIQESYKENQNKKGSDQMIQSLLWRDYFRFMFKKHGNLFFQTQGLSKKAPDIAQDEHNVFNQWKMAQTGEPIVDQGMKTLNNTGYITTQMRLILASYFVDVMQGHWLMGAAWFEEKLIDYGPSSNYGSWAHIAGVGSSGKENRPVNLEKLMTQV